ncbi:galactose oxidase, central domain-containing protein [Trichomonas vaginalis G3]|uniref:galactose oxidase, central domain-containing protein n=1 Tax=Trichomonas vaginalis (strain ATCC PRA-98 / G3) TaxID=412133 RepID=UPI0021E60DF2|nr:galactose oxidase, central domain-containing protein [Trichomonas vaginalis G3]KAI5491633.1 galactose oxidase, central domain-containing protein [Trichomonas vaginalis G3]
MWLIGGEGMTKYGDISEGLVKLSEIWSWDMKTSKWTLYPIQNRDLHERSVAFLNGHIYILSGQDVANCIWDIDTSNPDYLKWESIPIPDIFQVPISGSKIFICESLLLDHYLFITPGSVHDFYLSMLSTINITPKKKFNSSPLAWTAYNVMTDEFTQYKFSLTVPQTAYSTIIQDRVFIYFTDHNKKCVNYNKKLIKIKKTHLFAHETFDLVKCPKNYILDSQPIIPEFQKFQEVINSHLEGDNNDKRDSSERGYNYFLNLQKKTVLNFNDYVFYENLVAEKKVLVARYEKWSDALTDLPLCFVRDLFIFAYTDWIEETDREFIFIELMKFIKLLWQYKFYRLMWLELVQCFSKLSVDKVIALCSMTDESNVLADDKECALFKIVLYHTLNENMDKIATIINLSLLSNLRDYPLIIQSLKNKEKIIINISADSLPVSTIEYDLALMRDLSIVKCKDGKILANKNLITGVDFSQYDSKIVKAALTHRTKNSIQSIEDLISIFSLLNDADNIKYDFIYGCFRNNHSTIANFLLKDSEKLFQLLFLEKDQICNYIMEIIGEKDPKALISIPDFKIEIHSKCPVNFKINSLTFGGTKEQMYQIAYAFYLNLEFEKISHKIPNGKMAQAFLRLLSDNEPFLYKQDLIKVKDFVINILFAEEDGSIRSEQFAEMFVDCFRAKIHEECAKRCKDTKWIAILADNKANELDLKMINWIFNTTNHDSAPNITYEESVDLLAEQKDNSFVWVNQ